MLKNRHSKNPHSQRESWGDGVQREGGKTDISLLIPPTDHLFEEVKGRGKASLEWEEAGLTGAWPGLCAAGGGDLRFAPSQRGFVLSRRTAGAVRLRSTEELSAVTSCPLFKKIR